MSNRAELPTFVNVFLSYDPADEEHRIALEQHLSSMRREGIIRSWSSRNVGAGEEWAPAVYSKLGEARLFLLLASANLLASDHCFDVEIPRARERVATGEAQVILILVRDCDLGPDLFANLPTLPSNRRPVTSWSNLDEAWADVARGIRKAVEQLADSSSSRQPDLVRRHLGSGLSDDEMRAMATRLLQDAIPGSLVPLFPNIQRAVTGAIQELARQPRRVRYDATTTSTILDLSKREGTKQLVIAPRGAGKSVALWDAANAMLTDSASIPIFIPIGRFVSWNDVLAYLKLFASDPERILNDGRTVVFLDGWSEFTGGAGGDSASHRMVLSAIGNRRIVASARYGSEHDARFEIWHLEPFPGDAVRKVLQLAFPDAPAPADALLALLQLPLALVLHLLLGGPATSRGALLAKFQQKLSDGLPAKLTHVLARAAARTAIAPKTHRHTGFDAELERAGAELGLSEPIEIVRRLGTFDTNSSDVRPVHDLYWSWLVGVGLLETHLIDLAVARLDMRESIDLAIESGTLVVPDLVDKIRARDASLAMWLAAAAEQTHTALTEQVQIMLLDGRAVVRRRGVLAALQSGNAALFRSALNVVTDFHGESFCHFDIESALRVDVLWQHRSEVAAWIGGAGTNSVLEAIALQGDSRWSAWLERLVLSGRLASHVAGAVAIACSQTVPAWTKPFLVAIAQKADVLRTAANRGANVDLARWIAENYEHLIGEGLSWTDLNPILVQCGDDAVFATLLRRFETLPIRAQEVLGYAVIDRGDPWLSEFQRLAFANEYKIQHHGLCAQASLRIDDETARRWIDRGPVSLGWKVLVKRHGNTIVPELLKRLPESFSDLHQIPELGALSLLDDAPDEIVDELWKRVRGNISEAIWEALFHALARNRLKGMPSAIGFLRKNPSFLPSCSFSCFIVLLTQWEARMGFVVRFIDGTKERRFSEWIRLVRWEKERNEPLLGLRHSGGQTSLPISDDVLEAWAAGEASLTKFVYLSGPLDRYHAKSVEYLLSQPSGGQDVLTLFGKVLAQFPQAVLLRLLARMGTEGIEGYRSLLRVVAASNEPANFEFHAALIRRFLDELSLDIYASLTLASILRAHSVSMLRVLLSEAIGTANGLWLLRDTELACGFLLVDEGGHWLVP